MAIVQQVKLIPADWVENPPTDPYVQVAILEKFGEEIKAKTKRGAVLRDLFTQVKNAYNRIIQNAKDREPIAFAVASYHQSLLLNAWVWGISFPICFSANRIGKTVAFILNALLWLYPNNPGWKIFQRYTDEFGNEVEVLRRPRIESMLALQDFYLEHPELAGDPRLSHLHPDNAQKLAEAKRLVPHLFEPAYPAASIRRPAQIWLGAPDNDFHKRIIMRRWREYLTKPIVRDSEIDRAFIISVGPNLHHEIVCKSYESEETKWSGDAVDGIILTEGFDERILSEIKPRITNDGFMSWDYTPAEPRNVGKKVHLAHEVKMGRIQLPLKSYVFTKFSVMDAPSFIIAKEKKRDLVRMYEGTMEGKARLEGDFYSSSGLILAALDREFHCLDWTEEKLIATYPNGIWFRGLDPGFDHPTACVWGYLAPNNVWFITQCYSQRGKTIGERCEDIIRLSGNEREKIVSKAGIVTYREIHTKDNSKVVALTATDYHTFQIDAVSGLSYAQNYIKEGLVITESMRMGPEERAVKCNSNLARHAYIAHPNTDKPPGSRIFFLINGIGVANMLDKFDQLFWDRYKGGELRGEPKDRVPLTGDDEFDALCYIVCGPYTYTGRIPKPRKPMDAEPDRVMTPRLVVA